MNFYVPRVVTGRRVRPAGQADQTTSGQVYNVPTVQVENTPAQTALPTGTGSSTVTQSGASVTSDLMIFVGSAVFLVGVLGYFLTRVPEPRPALRTARARRSRG